MSSNFRPWPAAAPTRACLMRFRLPALLAAATLLSQGCARTPPQILAGADAADASAAVAPTAYRPVLAGYASQRPVEPSPWLERNRQVAPAPEKGGPK